jgi:hypothetical protein
MNEQQSTKEPVVSVDESNGWMANGCAPSEVGGDGEAGGGGEASALKIQIQLVTGYLGEALRANRYEEAEILEHNLNELLNVEESLQRNKSGR